MLQCDIRAFSVCLRPTNPDLSGHGLAFFRTKKHRITSGLDTCPGFSRAVSFLVHTAMDEAAFRSPH